MFSEKNIKAQSEQQTSGTAGSLSVRFTEGRFVLLVQKYGGDCTGRKLLQEMSVIFQPRYKMTDRDKAVGRCFLPA